MGYLVDKTPNVPYHVLETLKQHIKENGVIQFLNLYRKFKDHQNETILWGDEIEMHIVNIDPQTKTPRLQLNTEYIFESLNTDVFSLEPECGVWMVESIPAQPYECSNDPKIPFENFKARRKILSSLCKDGDVLFQGAAFPLLRAGDFFIPRNKVSSLSSLETADTSDSSEEEKEREPEIIIRQKEKDPLWVAQTYRDLYNPHPRYFGMTEGIIGRRKEQISFPLPMFIDEKTSMEKTEEEPFPGFIHLDETIFGTGNTSLQVTFGMKDIEEARYLTDQVAVISSILLPISAASPIFKGRLADVDTRWNILAGSLDCRTPEERDPNHENYEPHLRWGPTRLYISTRENCKDGLNDIVVKLNEEIMEFAEEQAKAMGLELDQKLIKHLGLMFKGDPLIAHEGKIHVNNEKLTNLFENLQSSTWGNSRFKPPPSFDSDCGWRVELRTIEAQLTPQESTAFTMFSYFLVMMIKKRRLNFYIPISKLHVNMKRAQTREAVTKEKFWWRENCEEFSEDRFVELTLDEILHGKEGSFVGLMNMINQFCKEEYGVDMQKEWAEKQAGIRTDVNVITENMEFFEILSQRVKGKQPTIASWIRQFVLRHPKYKKDSIVSAEIAGDLVTAMVDISDNKKTYSDFFEL